MIEISKPISTFQTSQGSKSKLCFCFILLCLLCTLYKNFPSHTSCQTSKCVWDRILIRNLRKQDSRLLSETDSYDFLHGNEDLARGKSVVILEGTSNRPVEGLTVKDPEVFTWYVERARNVKEKDNVMIENWKNSWRSYGYDPKVLNIEDAIKHPEFQTFNQSLTETLNLSIPQQRRSWTCYLRYLAMASQNNGGMMVDLDTTPTQVSTREDLPEKFTLFCDVEAMSEPRSENWLLELERQYGVPCAVVGTSAEWSRVAKLLLWTTKTFRSSSLWTDMHSLQQLHTLDEVLIEKRRLVTSKRRLGWDVCKFRYI
jgi:hypothetical protein